MMPSGNFVVKALTLLLYNYDQENLSTARCKGVFN